MASVHFSATCPAKLDLPHWGASKVVAVLPLELFKRLQSARLPTLLLAANKLFPGENDQRLAQNKQNKTKLQN